LPPKDYRIAQATIASDLKKSFLDFATIVTRVLSTATALCSRNGSMESTILPQSENTWKAAHRPWKTNLLSVLSHIGGGACARSDDGVQFVANN
jgi:hypothetical protein